MLVVLVGRSVGRRQQAAAGCRPVGRSSVVVAAVEKSKVGGEDGDD